MVLSIVDFTKIPQWFQIGLMYLKPVRPTLVVMRDTGRVVWGRKVLAPVMQENSNKFTIITDVDLMADKLNLAGAVEVSAYKFVAFDRPLHPWYPVVCLTVDPMDAIMTSHGKKKIEGQNVVFWQTLGLLVVMPSPSTGQSWLKRSSHHQPICMQLLLPSSPHSRPGSPSLSILNRPGSP